MLLQSSKVVGSKQAGIQGWISAGSESMRVPQVDDNNEDEASTLHRRPRGDTSFRSIWSASRIIESRRHDSLSSNINFPRIVMVELVLDGLPHKAL